MATARARLIIAIVLLVVLPACPSERGDGGSRTQGRAIVVRVIDGDTVILRFGRAVESSRLIGVDTPETVKPDTPVQCYGPEASKHTKGLLPAGTPVVVARDAEARDHFGRLLVYVWRRQDHLFVNLDLAAGGFARPLDIPPNDAHRRDIAAASAQARSAARGLWGACGSEPGPPR